MRSIAIVIVLVVIIASAPFAPTWFSQTKSGIGEVTEGHDLDRASKLPENDLKDAEVAPWFVEQTQIMIDSTGPLGWKAANFRVGPCLAENLADMAPGPYTDSMKQACVSMAEIQGRFGRDCILASNCNVGEPAKVELRAVAETVIAAHAAAGYTQ